MDDQEDNHRARDAASAALDTHAALVKEAGQGMLRGAPKVTRFVLKRIPGAPGFAFKVAGAAGEEDHLRGAFGVAGSVVGGLAGMGLGTLAGGVNAPIGEVLGSGFGEKLGEQIYDEHRNQIRQGAGDVASWMSHRWNDLTGR